MTDNRLTHRNSDSPGLRAPPPQRIATFLTCYGIQFADLPKSRSGPTALSRGHPNDRACCRCSIEHCLTKPNHPWINGQVERMNQPVKEATVQRYHCDSRNQLRQHLDDFVSAGNFSRRVKILKGLTPHEHTCAISTAQRERFNLYLLQKIPRLST